MVIISFLLSLSQLQQASSLFPTMYISKTAIKLLVWAIDNLLVWKEWKKIHVLKKNNDYTYIHVRCDYFLYYFRVAKICHCSICSLRYHDNGFPKQQIYATMLTFTSVCINVCNITKMVIMWAETPRYHFDSFIQLILCILYIIHLIFLQIPI